MNNGNGEDKILDGDGLVDRMTEMLVYAEDGQVIQRFKEPMVRVCFDPSNAVDVGKQFIDMAVECGANVEIVAPRPQVTREKRARMIQRTEHIYRSMMEKGRKPHFIAQQVVDTFLAEME